MRVSDNVGQDTGTLDAWGLLIDGGTENCIIVECPRTTCIPIPTLHPAGMAILALLLASGAVVLMRRRA